jgi:hypothetical protein
LYQTASFPKNNDTAGAVHKGFGLIVWTAAAQKIGAESFQRERTLLIVVVARYLLSQRTSLFRIVGRKRRRSSTILTEH